MGTQILMKWGPSSVDWGPKKRMFEKFAFKKGGGEIAPLTELTSLTNWHGIHSANSVNTRNQIIDFR